MRYINISFLIIYWIYLIITNSCIDAHIRLNETVKSIYFVNDTEYFKNTELPSLMSYDISESIIAKGVESSPVIKEEVRTLQKNASNFITETGHAPLESNFTFINDHTFAFFTPFTFEYSIKVNQCLKDYQILKKYLQKIALTFYYSNKTNHFGNEELQHNSTHSWFIKNDGNTNIMLKINISTPEGKIDNTLDITTIPGAFVNSIIHFSNVTWTERLSHMATRKSVSSKLIDILNIENKGVYSVKECICIFSSETQLNLGLKVSALDNCLSKLEEIIAAIKANPTAEFELTQKALDRSPSKLIIPSNMERNATSSNWRDSMTENQEIVSDDLFRGSGRKLVSTYIKGSEFIRQLQSEVRGGNKESSSRMSSDGNLTYFDSRDVNGKSCVYFPYDQGSCGGCYAFVVIASISISNCIQKMELPAPLSPQQIIDCSQKFGNLGCEGGFYSNGWNYLLDTNVPKNLICPWEEYPYLDSQGNCRAESCNGCLTVTKYNVFTGLVLNGEDAWDFVTTVLPKVGSISLSVNSNLPGFTSYSGGIYIAPKCTVFSELDHAVIMVGFGISADGEKYYVIQNSWGTSWGIGGFMNVSANSCDMFWYPGIIRQSSLTQLHENCSGNRFLLTGPGEVNEPPKLSGAIYANFTTSLIVIKLLLTICLIL